MSAKRSRSRVSRYYINPTINELSRPPQKKYGLFASEFSEANSGNFLDVGVELNDY